MKKIETVFWKEMLKVCEDIIIMTENLFDWTKNDLTLMKLHFNLQEFSFTSKAGEPYGIWIPKHMTPFPIGWNWMVTCPSCNQEFEWRHPEHWYTMCEDCVW